MVKEDKLVLVSIVHAVTPVPFSCAPFSLPEDVDCVNNPILIAVDEGNWRTEYNETGREGRVERERPQGKERIRLCY